MVNQEVVGGQDFGGVRDKSVIVIHQPEELAESMGVRGSGELLNSCHFGGQRTDAVLRHKVAEEGDFLYRKSTLVWSNNQVMGLETFKYCM